MSRIRTSILAALLFAGLVYAQSITLAGYGYAIPQGAVVAAPNQLMTISLYGIRARISAPVVGLFNGAYPTQLAGITVTLKQGADTPVGLRAVQQTPCLGGPSPCSPITTLTVLVPPQLTISHDAAAIPFFEIAENGVIEAEIPLLPVTDNIHIINSCDQTLISVGIFSALNGACVPAVQHADGGLVLRSNPAAPGETLMMWAYGLGAVQTFALDFNFRPNAPASPPVEGFGITGVPVFSGSRGAGLYQINFIVPQPPAGTPLCDASKIRSNLTITLSGFNSQDGAPICVKP
jgi:uncharacterized protein (TIGR03437 family)